MPFIKSGPGGAGGRCHTPSGQVPVKYTAGGPETPPVFAGVKQSGPIGKHTLQGESHSVRTAGLAADGMFQNTTAVSGHKKVKWLFV